MKSFGEQLLGELIDIVIFNSKYSNFNKTKLTLLSNTRPSFLYGLEMDYYIPELNLAFEFQGRQHYEYVDFFQRNDFNFLKQIFYDIQKYILCKRNNILLINISSNALWITAFKRVIFQTFDNYYKRTIPKHNTGKILYLPKDYFLNFNSPHNLLYRILNTSTFIQPSQKQKTEKYHTKQKEYRMSLTKQEWVNPSMIFDGRFQSYLITEQYRKIIKLIFDKSVIKGIPPILKEFLKPTVSLDEVLSVGMNKVY